MPGLLLVLLLFPVPSTALTVSNQGRASYSITATSLSPPRFAIRAELPLADDTLRVAQSWPCDLDSLCEGGWPVLVEDLRVMDDDGQVLRTDAIGSMGWVVRDDHAGRVILDYAVNYDVLAEAGWPARLEAAFSDGSALFTLGRILFVGTADEGPRRIRFALPPGMHASASWPRDSADADAFIVAEFDALVDNGVVIAGVPSSPITAGRFALELALFGRWNEQRDVVTRLLQAHILTFTRLLGFEEPGAYLAVFMEDPELGGESFVGSYAMAASPDSAVASWGRLIGHEIFHYWNGHRMRGADYTGSQWFQEGITEYYAILSMARNGFITPDDALEALSRHLRAHREFGKSLVASGNRKNRPFYGTATSVAFALDLMIRDATDNDRSLDDLMRRMWTAFGRSQRPYTQADVIEVASATAGRDLSAFFQRHVEGDVPLPMDSVLQLAGLRLVRPSEGEETIAEDPLAPHGRRELWASLITGRE